MFKYNIKIRQPQLPSYQSSLLVRSVDICMQEIEDVFIICSSSKLYWDEIYLEPLNGIYKSQYLFFIAMVIFLSWFKSTASITTLILSHPIVWLLRFLPNNCLRHQFQLLKALLVQGDGQEVNSLLPF